MQSQSAGRAIFVALFVLTLYLMYLIFRPFLPGIVWAIVLAVVFRPFYLRLERLFRGRCWAAATAVSLLIVAVVILPAVVVVAKISQGLVQGYEWLEAQSSAAAQAGAPAPADELEERVREGLQRQAPAGSALRAQIERFVDLDALDLRGAATSTLKTLGNALMGKTAGILKNVVSTLLTLIVLLVTMIVLFHEGPRLAELVRRLLPLSDLDKTGVFDVLRNTTRAVFLGVLLTALVQGTLGGLGFAFVGLPAPVLFGAVTFFAALLPGGTFLVWGPAVVWLFLDGHPGRALLLLAWGALVVSTADNLLRPLFIGRSVRMHALLVFFGIFGGMLAFGLVGLFLGPLTITLFMFLLEVLRRDLFRAAA